MASIRVRYFTAKWCGPCRAFGPVLAEVVASDAELELVKHDIDQQGNEAILKQYVIQSVPSVFFETPEGERLGELLGAVPKVELAYAISEARERLAALRAPAVPASKVPSVPVRIAVDRKKAKAKPRATARRTTRKAPAKGRAKAKKISARAALKRATKKQVGKGK
jgi:thioredoxin-like negative regulator of GroEL